jgi:hypothetical protein
MNTPFGQAVARGVRSGAAATVSVFVLSIGLAFLAPAPAWSHSGDLLVGFGTATVDGVISGNEYDSCVGPLGQTAGATTYTVTICETNDESNDYYAIGVNDFTNDRGGDLLTLLFDDEHDGKVIPCEQGVDDLLGVDSVALALGDSNYCDVTPGGFQFTGDASFDGQAAVTFTGGVGYVYEMSHPLNSGDAKDYGLAIGDTVGWCLAYDDGSNPADSTAFGELQVPAGCVVDAAMAKTGTFGDVQKVNEFWELLQELKGLVDSCEPCPPRPKESLLDKVNQAVRQQLKGHQHAAANALEQFVKKTGRFVESEQIPAAEGRQFVALAEQIIGGLSAQQRHAR